jgi:sec-independent protein translocase protein TatB
VFGLSFGELVVLLLVAVVVLGPKELPRYLRKAGQVAGRLRQLATEMRAKSGIDEVLRSEGIDADIAEIRRLATFARGELNGVVSAVRSATNGVRLNDVPASPYAPPPPLGSSLSPSPVATEILMPPVDHEREYPSGAPDSYDALPETANVYDGALPMSPLAHDPLYARGDDEHPVAEASS